MSEAFLERRRSPRVVVRGLERIEVPQGLTVSVVDMSASGVLLTSPQKLSVGQRARLHATLGNEALNVEVEVRRISEGLHGAFGRGRYRVGAAFVQPDVAARRTVRQFLRDEAV